MQDIGKHIILSNILVFQK